MVVQPRTLLIGIFSGVALVMGAVIYFAFIYERRAEDVPLVTSAQIVETSLYDMAVLANLVRAAYDQKIAADEGKSETEASLVCGETFREVDLSLLAQTLSVDIEQKIDAIVEQQSAAEQSQAGHSVVMAHAWANCGVTCTCSTMANLLDKAIEAGQKIDGAVLDAAQTGAESLTAADAIRCAQASKEICGSALVRNYTEQAATIE